MTSSQSQVAARPEGNEFAFTSADFNTIVEMVHANSGIVLGQSKEPMVYARLARRLRELKLTRFSDYVTMLKDPQAGSTEFMAFTNAMTTNLTRFFREDHHFEFLANSFLAEHALSVGTKRRLRIWSAGCSTGEEPYSIASILMTHVRGLAAWDAKILATDIDTNVLTTATKGLYSADLLKEIPPALRERHFLRVAGGYQVSPEVRSLVTFKPLNLLHQWPVRGPFDVIFCRNVMIYFDAPTKSEIVRRFSQLLRPGGYLIVGHSETLLDQGDVFRLCGRTIYQRRGV